MEGDTNKEFQAEHYSDNINSIPYGDKGDNNALVISMSITAGGLLIIILIMLFFVKPRRQEL
jgi:hypothetical protein